MSTSLLCALQLARLLSHSQITAAVLKSGVQDSRWFEKIGSGRANSSAEFCTTRGFAEGLSSASGWRSCVQGSQKRRSLHFHGKLVQFVTPSTIKEGTREQLHDHRCRYPCDRNA